MSIKPLRTTQRVTLTPTGWEIDATLIESTDVKERDSSKQSIILLRRNGSVVCRLHSRGMASIVAVLRLAEIPEADIREIRKAFKH